MRILAISNYFPVPPDMGGAIRVHGLLARLARDHDVHLLAPRREGAGPEADEAAGRELGIVVEGFSPHGELPRPGGAGLWARALWRRTPPWVLAQHDPRIARRAAELASEVNVCVVFDDYAGEYLEELRRAAPRLPIVADKPVVIGAASEQPLAHGAPLRRRIAHRLGGHLSRSFERRSLGLVDATVVTSDEEAARYRRLYGRDPDAVIVSAVELPRATTERRRGKAIGWLGSMDGQPIIEGLERFVRDGWDPLGREGFELRIAGRGAPPSVRELELVPGVRVDGYVHDLDAWLDELAAAVIPLWGGQGVKLKTLTLLGAGLPVAATPVAVEGVTVQDREHCLVAHDPQGLARALREVASDEPLAERLRAGSRRLVEQRYTWSVVADRFAHLVERTAAAP